MNHTEPHRTATNDAETVPAEVAAKRIGVSLRRLLDQCRDKQWPHHRPGRAIRFTEGDIAEILRITRVEPSQPAKAANSWGRQKRGA